MKKVTWLSAFAALLVLSLGLALAAAEVAAPKPQIVWIKENGEDTLVKNGSQNTFTLTHSPNDPAEFSVYVNGLYQAEGYDYVLAGGKTVIFRYSIPPAERVRFWYRGLF